MDKESKQQLHQLTETVTALGATVTTLTESVASLTSSVADLKAEMREGFAKVDEQFVEVKQDISDMKQDIIEFKQRQAVMQEDIASMKQDIANLQDSTYNLSVNLEDLDRRMGIGFASTTEKIGGLKRDMMEIKRELFLARGIRETEVEGLGKVHDSREAQVSQCIDMIEASLPR